jgi:hypothetical protein
MREIIRAPGHDRERSLGWLCLAWLEHFAVHGPGDVEGRPLDPSRSDGLPLDDEFAGLILDHYALATNGRRLYDSAFTSRAKGRAKSELAGVEVLFEGFGPCRFAGFATGGEIFEWRDFRYTYEPGEPMGRPIVYPFIRCLATEEGQSGNTYDNVYFNLTQGPLSEGLPTNCAGLTRTILPHGGEIIPSTASNAAKDGGKETHVVFDETHLYVLPELKRMYATVRRNMAKRKDAEPWSHETSTMYLPGENSVAEETHDLAKLIREHKSKRTRLFFDHRQAPEGVNLANEEELVAALREVYGPFSDAIDLQRIVDEIYDPRNDPGDSRRYWLNEPTAAMDSYISAPEWGGCLDKTKHLVKGDLITLGFDGSRGQSGNTKRKPDATALIATRISDAHQVKLGIWEAPDGQGQEFWTPPTEEIDAVVDRAFSDYKIGAFYADPAKEWRSKVNEWESKYGTRLFKGPKHKQMFVKREHPFEWWMTGGRSVFIQRAIEAFSAAVRNREMTHEEDAHYTQHVLNARRRIRATKLTLGKEHEYSPKKIDACIAGVLSYQACIDCIAAGIGTKPKRRAPVRVY